MSREVCGICWCPYDDDTGECACEPEPKALAAAAEREILADWMRQHGFSTGQAYTTATLLDRLGAEMVENTDAAVLEEREACAKLAEETVCDTHLPTGYKIYGTRVAKAIRARSNP